MCTVASVVGIDLRGLPTSSFDETLKCLICGHRLKLKVAVRNVRDARKRYLEHATRCLAIKDLLELAESSDDSVEVLLQLPKAFGEVYGMRQESPTSELTRMKKRGILPPRKCSVECLSCS